MLEVYGAFCEPQRDINPFWRVSTLEYYFKFTCEAFKECIMLLIVLVTFTMSEDHSSTRGVWRSVCLTRNANVYEYNRAPTTSSLVAAA